MTRMHYLYSFAIATLLYGTGGFLLIWLLSTKPTLPKLNEERIKVAVITPPKPLIKPDPIPVPVPIPPKPKVEEPKKIAPKLQPKPKPEPKKIIKKPIPKKIVKKVVPQPKAEPKPVIHEPQRPVIQEEPRIVETVQLAPPAPPKVDLSAHKKKFLNSVRGTIHAHKEYPLIAKKRNIQGRVHVIFDILQGGQISNIRTTGGSKILQKAARKSVLQSAPFPIPTILTEHFPMHNISVNIDFKLQ